MSEQFQKALQKQYAQALASANRGNPFISKADAMRAFAEFRRDLRAMGANQ